MNRKLIEIKEKIIHILKKHDVKRAAIFGSVARGEMTDKRDLDILIELDGDKSLLDIVSLKIEIEETLRIKTDIVEYAAIHPLLKEDILKEQVHIL